MNDGRAPAHLSLVFLVVGGIHALAAIFIDQAVKLDPSRLPPLPLPLRCMNLSYTNTPSLSLLQYFTGLQHTARATSPRRGGFSPVAMLRGASVLFKELHDGRKLSVRVVRPAVVNRFLACSGEVLHRHAHGAPCACRALLIAIALHVR